MQTIVIVEKFHCCGVYFYVPVFIWQISWFIHLLFSVRVEVWHVWVSKLIWLKSACWIWSFLTDSVWGTQSCDQTLWFFGICNWGEQIARQEYEWAVINFIGCTASQISGGTLRYVMFWLSNNSFHSPVSLRAKCHFIVVFMTCVRLRSSPRVASSVFWKFWN